MLKNLLANINRLEKSYPNHIGKFYWVLISLANTLIACTLKLITSIHGSQAAYYRSVVCTCIAVYMLKIRKINVYPYHSKLALKTCWWIASLGSSAFLLLFIAIDYISISKQQVFMCTNSLWLPILGYYILNQKFNRKSIFLVILSFFGVVLIIDPSLLIIFGNSNDKEERSGLYYFGCMLGLISGLFVALKRCLTIQGMKEIDTFHNQFYYQMGGSLLASFVNTASGFDSIIDPYEIPYLVLMTIIGLVYHGSLIHVMRLESNALVVGVQSNLQILWGFLFDTLAFGIAFDLLNGFGAFIIAVCGVLIVIQ